MAQSMASFFGSIGSTVFWLAATCFVVLNGAALAVFLVTRSRRVVDAWTPRLVAADLTLLGAGLGVPLLTGLAKLGIQTLGSMLGSGPSAAP